MSKHSRFEWRASHRKKRVYRTRWQARRACLRMAVRYRDFGLHPYQCRWMNSYAKGHTGPLHWHIGHPNKNRRKARRTLLKVYVIWPYYRVRRRWRRRRMASISSMAAH